ncbi:MAG: HD domain-containing protein [Calothrix sp. SM1_5_4]|nr:HD domain-containing protein [Calothrix sp. SM1_5_4]
MNDGVRLTAMLISLDAASTSFIKGLPVQWDVVERELDLEKLMEETLDPGPAVIFVGQGGDNDLNSSVLQEVAQLLRSTYPASAIYYVTATRKSLDHKAMVKNGFSDAFLLPTDANILRKRIEADLTQASKGRIVFYKAVNVVDVVPGTVLGFDVYLHLPSNNKHIRLAKADKPLDEKWSEKLKIHKVTSVYVTTDQMKNFYEFTAQQLRRINNGDGLSETEKQEKRERAIRSLLSDLYSEPALDDSFDKGRDLLNDCQQIIKSYVCGDGTGKNSWYEKMLAISNDPAAPYDHAANVATFSALLSIGLGVGNPEELAMAGLLHDIGLADLPPELQTKPVDQLTPDELEKYKKHPDLTLNIVKQRKLILPDTVLEIIGQHHERYDGGGFPKGVAGPRLKHTSQLVALADELSYAMRPTPDQKPRSPAEVINAILDKQNANPGVAKYDPALLSRVAKLFNKPSTETETEVSA